MENILKVQKRKLHGMVCHRWTTRDKITQFKGLINLYKRDRNIVEVDTCIEQKKQYRELKMLKKQMEQDGLALEKAIYGDKEFMANIFLEHRHLRLAYQNKPKEEVGENIEHLSFKKRKELDRLSYVLERRCQMLEDLKYEKAVLQDRLKCEQTQLAVEKEAQRVAGLVQDAILREQAALAIWQAYKHVLAVMQKDAMYFDRLLACLRSDGLQQNVCLLKATRLGQVATEYLDDRRQEYKALEHCVLRDMQARRQDLGLIQEQVETASANIKYLLRADNDCNTGVVRLEQSSSFSQLEEDTETLNKRLLVLQRATLMPGFSDIYPCLLGQALQEERLLQMTKDGENNHNALKNKRQHAYYMKNILRNNMISTTMEYKAKKIQIDKALKYYKSQKQEYGKQVNISVKILARSRMNLDQLQQLCENINYEKKFRSREQLSIHKDIPKRLQHETVKVPLNVETNPQEIFQIIIPKLTYLMSHVPLSLLDDPTIVDDTFLYYEAMMKNRTSIKEDLKTTLEQEFLDDLQLTVTRVLTREDIKNLSVSIVKTNMKKDYEA